MLIIAFTTLLACSEKPTASACDVDKMFELTQNLDQEFDRIMSLNNGDALYEQYKDTYAAVIKMSGNIVQSNTDLTPQVCSTIINLTEAMEKEK